jgi:hypothetical protein
MFDTAYNDQFPAGAAAYRLRHLLSGRQLLFGRHY